MKVLVLSLGGPDSLDITLLEHVESNDQQNRLAKLVWKEFGTIVITIGPSSTLTPLAGAYKSARGANTSHTHRRKELLLERRQRRFMCTSTFTSQFNA